MSASIALIKFKKTGNVYFGCYEGTSDVLRQPIFTADECWTDCGNGFYAYDPIRLARYLHDDIDKVPNDDDELDEVEIYSDYGSGFYWTGTGNEELQIVCDGLNPWEEDKEIIEGVPEWVKEFWE